MVTRRSVGKTIVCYTLILHVIVSLWLITIASAILPFDTSTLLLEPTAALRHLLHWDAVYFNNIAAKGYEREQELAFLPGLPLVISCKDVLVNLQLSTAISRSFAELFSTLIFTSLAGLGTVFVFFLLTKEISQNERFSAVATSLLLLSPAQATTHAVLYTEPFSALITFTGMLFFERQKFLTTALIWGCGSLFRAQAALLGFGFFGYRYLLGNSSSRTGYKSATDSKNRTGETLDGTESWLYRICAFSSLTIISAAPLIAFQVWAHSRMCNSAFKVNRPWCDRGLGMSYDWIQGEYWNVGLFRYWTFAQLPNFGMAAPVLALSFAASYAYYTNQPKEIFAATFPFLVRRRPAQHNVNSESPYFNPRLIPYVHLHTALTLLILFVSHVQIVLRLCLTNPVIFWYAAHLLISEGDGETSKRRKWGRLWLCYCVVWGLTSSTLWALFLPPA